MLKKILLVVLTTTEKYPNLNWATSVWLERRCTSVERVNEPVLSWITCHPPRLYTD